MAESEHSAYDAEVRERWGDTEAYAESSRRTKSYTPADWAKIDSQLAGIERGFAEAMAAGAPADGERATGLAEAARVHIDTWFYPCSHTMHAALAEMYTSDERFRAHYDDQVEGLATYVSEAIKANLARQRS